MSVHMNIWRTDTARDWHARGVINHCVAIAVMVGASVAVDALSPTVALLLAVSAATVLTIWATGRSRIVAEKRLTLLFTPSATIGTVWVLHLAAPSAASLVLGLFVLAFLFVGVSQPPRTSVLLLVPAAVVYVQVLSLPAAETAVRLPIAVGIWILVAEVPSTLVNQLRQQRAHFRTLATTDPLTGLLNRSGLEEHLRLAGDRAAVAVIDLDHFKALNDRSGHAAGDAALRHFAQLLSASCRRTDSVFRVGGEEFVIIFRNTSVRDASGILQKLLRAAIETGALSFSAGVTAAGTDAYELADALMYEAKLAGRSTIVESRTH